MTGGDAATTAAFDGRIALVTGGASGIGLACAQRLAAGGARVMVVDTEIDAARAAAADLREAGLAVDATPADVTVAAEVDAAVARTGAVFGTVDLLVNNAAISSTVSFLDGDREQWRAVFEVIVEGAYLCSRAVAQPLVAAGRPGTIVNISSINSSRAAAGTSHYNTAKGALDQLTRCLAVELADAGIRVNAVAPGFVDTPMSVVAGVNELTTDWFATLYQRHGRLPLRRAARPHEIAAVVAFLSSADASYMCGAVVPVDGGLSVTF